MKIAIETVVDAPLAEVWRAWTTPEDIVQWNAASDDWHTIAATVDLRVGGAFLSRMEAKDGSMGFDFVGAFTRVVRHDLLEYLLGDSRVVSVEFLAGATGVTVRETFDTEDVHAAELQRKGWQAILDNFARHVHATSGRAGAGASSCMGPTERSPERAEPSTARDGDARPLTLDWAAR